MAILRCGAGIAIAAGSRLYQAWRRNVALRVGGRIALVFVGMVGVPMGVAKLAQRGPMPDVTAWIDMRDAATTIRVYDPASGTTQALPLNEYIFEVLAAEFAPNAPIASLEATAVATRTYAVRAMAEPVAGSLAAAHDADLTDDSNLDLPLVTEAELQSEYPNQALGFTIKLKSAIEATDGTIITYQNKPIMAFMSAVSTGKTRSSEDALGQAIPYLVSIPCPDDVDSPAETWTDTLSIDDIEQAMSVKLSSLSDMQLTRGSDGFVQSVKLGDKTVTGAEFAARLNLQSDDFAWKLSSGSMAINGVGRGSDLGMSLHEAQAMAMAGQSWETIIRHFYPHTSLQNDQAFVRGKH